MRFGENRKPRGVLPPTSGGTLLPAEVYVVCTYPIFNLLGRYPFVRAAHSRFLALGVGASLKYCVPTLLCVVAAWGMFLQDSQGTELERVQFPLN